MTDSKALVQAKYHQVEDCDPIDEATKQAARRLVAAHSVGENTAEQVADAIELMKALGIYPNQEVDEYVTTRIASIPNAAGSRFTHPRALRAVE